MATETFIIKRRPLWAFMGDITVSIECDPLAPTPIKLGLAVKAALKQGANLSAADLRAADLRDADLRDANLRAADLSDANLSDANLRAANLRAADLRAANLRAADLSDANLRDADLSDADLRAANPIMPDGLKWSEYLRDVVPALLTAGGKTMEEIKASGCWECHTWENCPMHVAFGVSDTSEMVGRFALYRPRADEFIRYFDARLIPAPWGEEPEAADQPEPVSA